MSSTHPGCLHLNENYILGILILAKSTNQIASCCYHTYSMPIVAVSGFFRCIKLALVHDMAECIVGDIAPSDNISKAEKHRREEASDRKHSKSLIETT